MRKFKEKVGEFFIVVIVLAPFIGGMIIGYKLVELIDKALAQ